ncbi:GIY-YIG nuclease family protein [Arcobacter sp. YIC-80]|uniref:GIY-YIG nuclease family protein n=1 Tax=Arcobacter sp. YIC-80 TaxID=3376683 RepID=UPI00384FB135
MKTLKQMVIDILVESDSSLIIKDLTTKLIKKYPEKLEAKILQKDGDKKQAISQLKAEISSLTVDNDSLFFRDKSSKPVKVGLIEENEERLEIESQDENFESDLGIVYILGTNTFTKDGCELVKIGLTTLKIQERIKSLYTSGVPFEFTVLREYKTPHYEELEKAMHKLLNSFRPNPSREFFIKECLLFADEVYELHKKIENL